MTTQHPHTSEVRSSLHKAGTVCLEVATTPWQPLGSQDVHTGCAAGRYSLLSKRQQLQPVHSNQVASSQLMLDTERGKTKPFP